MRWLCRTMCFTLSAWGFTLSAWVLFSQPLWGADKKPKILAGFGDRKEEPKPLEYPMVGDKTGIDGLRSVKVEGVGLVVGLRGTGSDPAPNSYRDQLLEDMRVREIYQPQQILASEATAVVLLRAFIPPGARKGDRVDVEVWVPPGDSTTSLKGGRLLESSLSSTVVAKGRRLEGNELLKATGHVLINGSADDPENTAGLLKGKILGQGVVTSDRDFRIILSRDIRSGRLTKQLAHRINQRFFVRDGTRKYPAAIARDEKMVELKLMRAYRFDIERYLLVVRRIPMSVSQSFIHQTLQYLRDELLNPATAIEAALRLEAIGNDAIPVLEEGLKSDDAMVRFCSAQSLCYLGDVAGAEELAKLARQSNDYRAYALTALVALDHPVTRITLSSLLNSDSAETRYGAFRSLWAHDASDPLIQGEDLADEFYLHEIDSAAEPMIHLSRTFRREVVLFKRGQKFQTPLLLRAGDLVLHAAAENEQVHLSSFKPSEGKTVTRHATASLNVADVIRSAVSLGATYPDVIDLLQQAKKNGNLASRLEVNALPKALPLETLNAIVLSDSARASRVSAPSLFTGSVDIAPEATGLTASEDEDSDPEPEEPKKRRTLFDLFRRSGN